MNEQKKRAFGNHFLFKKSPVQALWEEIEGTRYGIKVEAEAIGRTKSNTGLHCYEF